MQHIRRRLSISQGILADALPSHVVSALLRDDTSEGKDPRSEAEETGELPPLPRPHMPRRSGSGVVNAAEIFRREAQPAIMSAGCESGGSLFKVIVLGSVGGSNSGRVTEDGSASHSNWLAPSGEDNGEVETTSCPSSSLLTLLLESGTLHQEEADRGHAAARPPNVSALRGRTRSASGECSYNLPSIRDRTLSVTESGRQRSSDMSGVRVAGAAYPPSERCFCSNQRVAAHHECVTVFFSDICKFSTWAHRVPPEAVMRTLNDLYTRLDCIIVKEMPSLYKVETIGDAYIVAANLFEPDPQHAATMARFALRAQQEVAKVLRPDAEDGSTLQMRMGE